MATKPSLPNDEQPLDAATIDLLLSNIGTDMILVGGQALAFWMDRFGVDADGAAISNDGDALGELATARALAAAISARLVVPRKTARTSVVAQLRLPAAGGKERNIDVLHLLYTISGLRKSSDFTRQVYTLARSQVGRRLWSEHCIELLAAIDIDALEAAAPRLSRQLDAIRTTVSDRRGVAGRKPSPR